METRISSWGEEEGRERGERFENDRETEIAKVGCHKKGRESTVAEQGIGVRNGSGGLAARPIL